MADKVLILGDSHVLPYARALKEWPAASASARLHAVFVDSGLLASAFVLRLADGLTILNPVMEKALDDHHLYNRYTDASFPEVADLVLLFGYAYSHMFGITRNIDGYCFELPADASGPGGEVNRADYLLHPDVLTELFATQLANLFEGVALLKRRGLKVSLLAGPPPHRENDFILSRHPWRRCNAPLVRKAIFTALDGVIRSGAARLGVPYVDAVSAFSDENGFLSREYDGDGIHANPTYARRVLEVMARTAGWDPGVIDSARG